MKKDHLKIFFAEILPIQSHLRGVDRCHLSRAMISMQVSKWPYFHSFLFSQIYPPNPLIFVVCKSHFYTLNLLIQFKILKYLLSRKTDQEAVGALCFENIWPESTPLVETKSTFLKRQVKSLQNGIFPAFYWMICSF